MELSKRALGFLCRQYRIILSQNRLANALGTCALSALMCATAGFVAPENALAAVIGVDIPAATESWSSMGDISASSTTSGVGTIGIKGNPTGSLSITLASGHALTVMSNVTGGGAEGIGFYSRAGGNIAVTSNGTVAATATGDTASAYGIYASARNGNTTVTNSGAMTISATAETGNAKGTGIKADAGSNNTIINSGAINISATSKSGNADVTGINGMGKNNSIITNSGAVNISAMSEAGNAYAYGLNMNSGIINSGTVDANVKATMYACAYGIYANSIGNNDITNSGAINISATSAADDAMASGIYASAKNSDITNNGTMNISAIAEKGDAIAYGIEVAGASLTINNFGIIDVSAIGKNTEAYQVYLYDGTANIGTWAIKLGEKYGTSSPTDTGKGYHVFGVVSGATLNFGVDGKGADFIIAGFGDNFKLGQEYKIRDMVYNNGGTVTGYIASATSPFDFLPVEVIGSGSYDKQSIKATLDLSKDKSPAHAGATQLLATVKGHMNGLSKVLNDQRAPLSGASNAGGSQSGMRSAKSDTATMYADAGTTFTDAGGSYVTPESPLWKVFLTPFYSTTSAHGDAYETDMGGFVVGVSRNMNDAFVFGFHASFAKADSDSTYTDSDALSYALGINGVYNIDESLYVRSQLTGFSVKNELDMVSSTGSLAQKASADMDSYGMYVELAAGFDIALAPEHMLTPELGLSYVYAQMEGFESTFVGGISPTPFSMDSENYNALYADASVRWTGTFDLGNRENGNNFGTLKPTVKAGIRQAFMDPETSSTMNIFGSSATTHADANETSFTCEAGLMWDFGALNTSLTYMGEFGNVENSHMGMFKAEWEF